MRFFFVILLIIIQFFPLFAKVELAAYPSAGFSNETKFYGGALAYLRYRPASFLPDSPKNVFYLSSSYSQKKQFIVFFQPTLHFKDGLYRFEGEIQFKEWPTDFYGIGMKTDRDDFESFTSIEKSMKMTLVKKLNQFWEAGVYYEVMDYDISKVETGGILDSGAIPGYDGSFTSGLGLKLYFDNRNFISYPTEGNLMSLQINRFFRLLGSDHEFTELILDLRKYTTIDERNTFATQAFFKSIHGNTPFNQLVFLDENMRAITGNLFIDKNAFVLRAEDRFFAWQSGFLQRLGLAFFAELGETAPQIGKFNITDLQLNYGIGFRYSFFLEDRMNIRLDVGFGEVKFNISIASGEAF